MPPDDPDRFDRSSLFGVRVLSASGERLGLRQVRRAAGGPGDDAVA